METNRGELGQPEKTKRQTKRRNEIAVKVIPFAILVWIAFLISLIVLKGTDIGTPASADAALIAANERLLQMVQWTIGTVLTLGGALIGLNWYQSEKRYDHDRQLFEDRITAEMDRKLEEHKQHLDMVSRASLLSLDSEAARTIRESVGPRDGTVNDLGFVDRVLARFTNEGLTLARRGVGRVLIDELIRAASTVPGKPGRLEAYQIARIKEVVVDLTKDAPDLAEQVDAVLKAYELWHVSGEVGSTTPGTG
jgi:hypothetical protein